MNRRPPRSTPTDTLLPYTTRFRSRTMLVLRRVVIAGSIDQNRQRRAGVRRVRTDANRDRAAIRLDHPSRRDERARAQRQQHGEQQQDRSEEHTSELQSLMRNSYAVLCLKKKKHTQYTQQTTM